MNETGNIDESCAVAVPAEPTSGKWQPIETAPKDGSEILLYTSYEAELPDEESFSSVQIGSWDDGNIDVPIGSVWYRAPGWDCPVVGKPTHWMPLPEPPRIDAEPAECSACFGDGYFPKEDLTGDIPCEVCNGTGSPTLPEPPK
jgi:hypothetical protein